MLQEHCFTSGGKGSWAEMKTKYKSFILVVLCRRHTKPNTYRAAGQINKSVCFYASGFRIISSDNVHISIYDISWSKLYSRFFFHGKHLWVFLSFWYRTQNKIFWVMFQWVIVHNERQRGPMLFWTPLTYIVTKTV